LILSQLVSELFSSCFCTIWSGWLLEAIERGFIVLSRRQQQLT
jgi:hypothetical protein